jgi:hypothetical protein
MLKGDDTTILNDNGFKLYNYMNSFKQTSSSSSSQGLFDISFNDASFSNDGHTVFLGRTDGKVALVFHLCIYTDIYIYIYI